MSATITVVGNLGGDPAERMTQSGHKNCNFSVANNIGKDADPNWYYVTVWGKPGENCLKYLRKGSKVQVIGELKVNEKSDKTWLNVNAYKVDFLSKPVTVEDYSDSEIPF